MLTQLNPVLTWVPTLAQVTFCNPCHLRFMSLCTDMMQTSCHKSSGVIHVSRAHGSTMKREPLRAGGGGGRGRRWVSLGRAATRSPRVRGAIARAAALLVWKPKPQALAYGTFRGAYYRHTHLEPAARPCQMRLTPFLPRARRSAFAKATNSLVLHDHCFFKQKRVVRQRSARRHASNP